MGSFVPFVSCSSLFFFLYISLPLPPLLCFSLHLSAYLRVCEFVYVALRKCHWQLQIKMGGEYTTLSPCNAKGVECHKSPFDLSNPARSCCMQTFFIGRGGGVSGLFCPYASLSCSWWSPPKDEGIEQRWKGRGKNREEKEKGHNCEVSGADSETKEKDTRVCCSSLIHALFHYFSPIILPCHVLLRAGIWNLLKTTSWEVFRFFFS